MRQIGILGLAAIAAALCYAGVLRNLAETWATSYAYSYGFVVFLVSAYLFWSQSAGFRTLRSAPDYLFGVPLMIAGMAILAIGRLGLFASLQEASLVVTIAGFVLLLFGREALLRVSFPLAYLLLSIPLWDGVIARLQPPSQVLSARLASGLMQIIGIPVFREGTRLVLPNVTLDVMRECSGVNQVVAIVSMALPAAYLMLEGTARRAALIGLAVLTAYVSNGVRIALVGFLSYRGLSNGELHGMHLFEGLVVSLIGYVFLFGCLSLLSRGEKGTRGTVPASNIAPPNTVRTRRLAVEYIILIVVLAAGAFQVLFRPRAVQLETDLQAFPRHVDKWTVDSRPEAYSVRFPAIDDELVRAYPSAAGERRFAAMDDDLVRAYSNASRERLHLFIGYRRFQQEGNELIAEASQALNAVATPVDVQLDSGTVQLREVVQESPSGSRGILYWYDFNGRTFSSIYLAKKYLLWDSLTRRRTNGAVVMIGWESHDGSASALPRAGAVGFARSILLLLPRFIPS